ncbi:MAG: hypothetical protein CLLPBCKN_007727 [Chroococcidiopsis cubana SAG 39.79]|nr:hypothetical protein [Chroococcidiopsis cubana SAG 39.79]
MHLTKYPTGCDKQAQYFQSKKPEKTAIKLFSKNHQLQMLQSFWINPDLSFLRARAQSDSNNNTVGILGD